MRQDPLIGLQEILNSLKKINGFIEFEKFLGDRIKVSDDWKAEVKALYEINKPTHPLIEICSQGESEPEGKFILNNVDGIVEVAHIKYLFDANHEKNKLINRINNCFGPFCKQLVNKYRDYVIKCMVLSVDKQPSDVDLRNIKDQITLLITRSGDNSLNFMPWGVVGFFKEGQFPKINDFDNPDLILVYKSAGCIVGGQNVDLNQKILRKIDEKRKQHSQKYSTYLKVFYFLVDSPPTVLDQIDDNRVGCKLSENEIVVVCSVWYENGNYHEIKKIYGDKKQLFDFSNIFYQSSSRYNT